MNEWKPDAARLAESGSVVAQLAAAGFEDAQAVGRGGFGVVFRCRQPSVERDVAVKVLMNGLDGDGLQRFLREQRAMGRLSGHPNIVEILSVGTTRSGLPFIVMPYLARDSLERSIRVDGILKWDDAFRVGVRVAGALETAHRSGILHRDVKPANILLTDFNEPQLADFGIARMGGSADTVTGVVAGSAAYIAPEVLAGGNPSPASDVYGLAATLFCALTGQAPFERLEGEAIAVQLLRITAQSTPRLRGRCLVPDDVADAIDEGTARDPADRPGTAATFGDRLRAIEYHHNNTVDEMVLLPEVLSTDGREASTPSPTPTKRSISAGYATGNSRSMEADAPAQLGTQGTGGNIPLELTSFIGRRRELLAVKNILSASRMVSLTGIGGVGKTRLALRIAQDGRLRYTDGVWLIELGEVREEPLVVGTVAASLGILNQSAELSFSDIANYLLDKNTLLVFDNCEHLLGTVSALAETLLRVCPRLKILATSREPLGVAGESVVRVAPMSIPDPTAAPTSRRLPRYESITLFVDRAAAALPGFKLDDDNERVVAQICRHLDGLPLAIELAAGRLRAMSAEQILDRLDNRYQILTHGNRAAPSRQQTLQVCIDWSYNLCTATEQLAWSRVAIFASSFELDAAEAICGPTDSASSVLDALAQLVDKSILIREQPGRVVRYRLLDTLRDYGREMTRARGEYKELLRRHRDWYEHMAQQAHSEWISVNQREWVSRLRRERPNLHEALRYCSGDEEAVSSGLRMAAALLPFWECQGLLSEGRLWLDRLLAVDTNHPATAQAKALLASSILAGLQGDIAAAGAQLADGLKLSARLEDTSLSTLASHAAGCVALYNGDPWTAIARSNDAIRSAKESDYHYCQVGALAVLGVAYMMLGDAEHAANCHKDMLEVTESRGDLVHRGRSSMSGGWAMWKRGEPEQARAIVENGLRLSSQIDDPVGVTRCLTALAWIEAGQHKANRTTVVRNAKRAAVLLGATASLCREIGGPSVGFLENLADHRDCVNSTRELLGENGFETQFHLGNSLNLHDAAAYALGDASETTATRSAGKQSLTRREREVAELVAEGLTNRAIATRLVISLRTVQGHVEHILTKLDLTSRTQIAVWIHT
ncbi:protein kinase domain-containing protein [Rhodococcus qingshengii]|uniref:protein kinase domain-containing protein n=1 Tax=Rhodococcus qingshengii TaxID=334542 RepID=UPI0035DA8F68